MVSFSSNSKTLIEAPTIAGANELENKYGRERWRKISIISHETTATILNYSNKPNDIQIFLKKETERTAS